MAARDPLPDQISGIPFRVREALALGVTPARVRSADLVAPFSGVRMPAADAPDLAMRCRALQAALPDESAFVGPTAARLRGMPLPVRSERSFQVHVSTTGDRRPPRIRGAVGARRPEWWGVDVVGGLRVVGGVETWMSLAPFLDVADLTAVADFLIGPRARRAPAFVRAELADGLRSAGPARGIRHLRTALRDSREGVRSRPETHLRLLLACVGPREPDVAASVEVAPGRVLHPDLSWPEFKVGVEYDGSGHRNASQHAIDVARHEEFVDGGWSLLHVVAGDLYGAPSLVVARVLQRLRAAGWTQPRAELTLFARFER